MSIQDSLRQRFGNALQWFNNLQQATDAHVDGMISNTRCSERIVPTPSRSTQSPVPPSAPSETATSLPATLQQAPVTPSTPSGQRRVANEVVDDEEGPGTPTPRVATRLGKTVVLDVDQEDQNTPTSKTTQGARIRPNRQRRESVALEAETAQVYKSPFAEPPVRERPSDYLRSRCALCFGGSMPRSGLRG